MEFGDSMKICKKCGKQYTIPFDIEYCRDCASICPKCGIKKGKWGGEIARSINRDLLCDRCWENEKQARGYDPETYAGLWYELLATNQLFSNHLLPPNLLPSGRKKNATGSNIAGAIAGKVIGIGWKSILITKGTITLQEYPVEIIRIEDSKDTYKTDSIFTAKIYFFGPISEYGSLVSVGTEIGSFKAKWKGLISKSFVGIEASTTSQGKIYADTFFEIQRDPKITADLDYLLNQPAMFNEKWLGPDVDWGGTKFKLTITGDSQQRYLMLESRTIRTDMMDAALKDTYRNAFGILLSIAAGIVQYFNKPPQAS